MSNKFIPAFGIEVHAELLTKTKAFSPAAVNFNAPPNTSIHPIDLGYPGTKPVVNKKMVEFSYRLAKILKMDIENKLWFDRKNYFYPDLPKGFQITQYFKPIGTNGKLSILVKGKKKDITITEIHMEEDTAKQIRTKEGIMFDFNRAGVPLIEIVSGHKELSSIDEVIEYVKQLKEQLVIMGINDGKLEEGSFRVDVNVSVKKENDTKYGERTEIKNLNSFKNIRLALEYEINRHIEKINNNQKIESYTVRYDDSKNITIPMRLKDAKYDYSFIPEGNITPIVLSEEDKKSFEENNDINVFDFRNIWKEKMNSDEIFVILSNKKIFDTFNDLIKIMDEKESINFIVNDLKSALNEVEISEVRINVYEIRDICQLRKEGKIDTKKTKTLIFQMFKQDIEKELKELDKKVLLKKSDIEEIILNIIEDNKDMIEKDKDNRPERVEKFCIGQVMKKTKGAANAKLVSEVLKEKLWAQEN